MADLETLKSNLFAAREDLTAKQTALTQAQADVAAAEANVSAAKEAVLQGLREWHADVLGQDVAPIGPDNPEAAPAT